MATRWITEYWISAGISQDPGNMSTWGQVHVQWHGQQHTVPHQVSAGFGIANMFSFFGETLCFWSYRQAALQVCDCSTVDCLVQHSTSVYWAGTCQVASTQLWLPVLVHLPLLFMYRQVRKICKWQTFNSVQIANVSVDTCKCCNVKHLCCNSIHQDCFTFSF